MANKGGLSRAASKKHSAWPHAGIHSRHHAPEPWNHAKQNAVHNDLQKEVTSKNWLVAVLLCEGVLKNRGGHWTSNCWIYLCRMFPWKAQLSMELNSALIMRRTFTGACLSKPIWILIGVSNISMDRFKSKKPCLSTWTSNDLNRYTCEPLWQVCLAPCSGLGISIDDWASTLLFYEVWWITGSSMGMSLEIPPSYVT